MIKGALTELYKGLNYLKTYRNLNMLAFMNILKNFDKVSFETEHFFNHILFPFLITRPYYDVSGYWKTNPSNISQSGWKFLLQQFRQGKWKLYFRFLFFMSVQAENRHLHSCLLSYHFI